MKAIVKKNSLIDALNKIHPVATKGTTPDFDMDGRVTISASLKTGLTLSASNGYLDASYHLTKDNEPSLDSVVEGKLTVDSIKLRNCMHDIKTESPSDLISLSEEDGCLLVKPVNTKCKRAIKFPRDQRNHEFSISYPTGKHSQSYIFEEGVSLIRAIKTVAPFSSKQTYKLHYQTVCLHWINNEVRFVCGDGTLFAVYSIREDNRSFEEVKKIIPVSHLLVLADILDSTGNVILHWSDNDDSKLFVQSANMDIQIKGIPEIDYIDYANNAYRFDEAKSIVDIRVDDLKNASQLVGHLADDEKIEQAGFHRCKFVAPGDTESHLNLAVTNKYSKFQCDYEVPASYYNVKDQVKFEATYVPLFFDHMAKACKRDYIRFYLINENGVANARDVSLSGDVDESGMPKILDENENLSFFFAACKDLEAT